MPVVYLVTVFFVIALLLSLPLFPFWKVWDRLKNHYPDIWNAKGPFDISSLLTAPALLNDFLGIIEAATTDEAMKKSDPELVKWCNMAQGIRAMGPKSFPAQVGYFLIFMYFTGFLTTLILTPFRH